jgi:hypothetical protein
VNIQRRERLTEKEITHMVAARKAGVKWTDLVKRFGVGADTLRKLYVERTRHEIC